MGQGPIEQAVHAQTDDMGDLMPAEGALAELAYSIAKAIDALDDPGKLAALSKELRLVLKQLSDGHVGGEDSEWGDMGTTE